MHCTAVERCFQNILDVMVLENIMFSSDKIGRLPLWSNETDLGFCHQSAMLYTLSTAYISFHMYTDLEVFNFSERITCLAFHLVL
jgi:hypothetical protein